MVSRNVGDGAYVHRWRMVESAFKSLHCILYMFTNVLGFKVFCVESWETSNSYSSHNLDRQNQNTEYFETRNIYDFEKTVYNQVAVVYHEIAINITFICLWQLGSKLTWYVDYPERHWKWVQNLLRSGFLEFLHLRLLLRCFFNHLQNFLK